MQKNSGPLTLHKTTGFLRYSIGNTGHNLIVEVCPDISYYYRSLIPKAISTDLNGQRYLPHISVVRKETPINLDVWNKYQGKSLEFEYTNEIYSGEIYYWLNAFSTELEEIRAELGLPVTSPYTRPPGEYKKCFHITIANQKNLP